MRERVTHSASFGSFSSSVFDIGFSCLIFWLWQPLHISVRLKMMLKLLILTFSVTTLSTTLAGTLREDIRAFGSVCDSMKTSVEVFDQHPDFISLRFDCLVRRSHISALTFNEDSVQVILISGDRIAITPETEFVRPVLVHEALTWILYSGKHKHKAATLEQRTQARKLIERAIAEDDSTTQRDLSSAQSLWTGISPWSFIAQNCTFKIHPRHQVKDESGR